VGITAHIARLRAVVGHELLLAPSVSVLPVDQAGRLLLVRHAGHDDGWGVLGGAVDVGESPAAAAAREAREEISADVQLLRLVDVLGGPDREISYPNGDRTAYVTAVYEARIINGSPAPGDGELSELAWFTHAELPGLQLSRFSRALLQATGRLGPFRDCLRPSRHKCGHFPRTLIMVPATTSGQNSRTNAVKTHEQNHRPPSPSPPSTTGYDHFSDTA